MRSRSVCFGPQNLFSRKVSEVVGKRPEEIEGDRGWNTAWPFRLPIKVNTAGYERINKPVEVDLDFAQLRKTLGRNVAFSPASIRLVETDNRGTALDEQVAFQFDPIAGDNPGEGILTFMLNGITPANATRHFYLYFGSPTGDYSSPAVRPQVSLTDNVIDEEQESFKVVTQNATYFYHKRGAGFSSMVDIDGQDWLGYHPGGGSAGEYRGIPNMGHPEGYCHPGMTVSRSQIIGAGPLKVSILSRSNDGKMACRWDIFPHYARLTVLKMRTPYWFLYEGTPGGNPGGRLDEEHGYCVRSTGAQTPLAQKWEGAIPAPEWLYFGAGNTKRVIYLVHHEADDAIDSYWPMENNMTVFGFGRLGLAKFMDQVPAHFTIGFAEDGDFAAAARVIESAYRELIVTVRTPEQASSEYF